MTSRNGEILLAAALTAIFMILGFAIGSLLRW